MNLTDIDNIKEKYKEQIPFSKETIEKLYEEFKTVDSSFQNFINLIIELDGIDIKEKDKIIFDKNSHDININGNKHEWMEGDNSIIYKPTLNNLEEFIKEKFSDNVEKYIEMLNKTIQKNFKEI